MKNFFLIIIAIIGLTFSSCSDTVKTKTMPNMYQNINDALKTKTSTFKYVIVPEDTNLWDIAKKYLGNGLRHMEIANKNYKIYQNPDRFRFTGKNPHWTYGHAKKGEKLYLPDDAFGPDVLSEHTSLTFLKDGINIKDYSIGDLEVVTNDYSNHVSKTNQSGVSWFGAGFAPTLWDIFLLLFVLAVIVAFILWLIHIFNENSSTTTRTTENDCCRELSGRLDQILENQNEGESCPDNTTMRLKELPAIIKAAGEASGENGRTDITMKDGSFELGISNSKEPEGYSEDEVDEIVNDELDAQQFLHDEVVSDLLHQLLIEQMTLKSIIILMQDEKFPSFKTEEEVDAFAEKIKESLKKDKK